MSGQHPREEWNQPNREEAASDAVEGKLAPLRVATRYEFPAPDIDQMIEETQRG